MKRDINNDRITDNQIGDEGAKALSEMLQVNTTLTSLNLESVKHEKKKEANAGMMIE